MNVVVVSDERTISTFVCSVFVSTYMTLHDQKVD